MPRTATVADLILEAAGLSADAALDDRMANAPRGMAPRAQHKVNALKKLLAEEDSEWGGVDGVPPTPYNRAALQTQQRLALEMMLSSAEADLKEALRQEEVQAEMAGEA